MKQWPDMFVGHSLLTQMSANWSRLNLAKLIIFLISRPGNCVSRPATVQEGFCLLASLLILYCIHDKNTDKGIQQQTQILYNKLRLNILIRLFSIIIKLVEEASSIILFTEKDFFLAFSFTFSFWQTFFRRFSLLFLWLVTTEWTSKSNASEKCFNSSVQSDPDDLVKHRDHSMKQWLDMLVPSMYIGHSFLNQQRWLS